MNLQLNIYIVLLPYHYYHYYHYYDYYHYYHYYHYYYWVTLLSCHIYVFLIHPVEVLASDDEVPAAQTASEQSLSERFCGSTRSGAEGANQGLIWYSSV
jgi:hypothetical protein